MEFSVPQFALRLRVLRISNFPFFAYKFTLSPFMAKNIASKKKKHRIAIRITNKIPNIFQRLQFVNGIMNIASFVCTFILYV